MLWCTQTLLEDRTHSCDVGRQNTQSVMTAQHCISQSFTPYFEHSNTQPLAQHRTAHRAAAQQTRVKQAGQRCCHVVTWLRRPEAVMAAAAWLAFRVWRCLSCRMRRVPWDRARPPPLICCLCAASSCATLLFLSCTKEAEELIKAEKLCLDYTASRMSNCKSTVCSRGCACSL